MGFVIGVGSMADIIIRSGIAYLLLARFNAPNQGYANGQVLNTAAEGVTVGQLTVVEVDGTLGIVANECAFTAQVTPVFGDEQLYSQAIAKAFGRTALIDINWTALPGGGAGHIIIFANTVPIVAGGNREYAFYIATNNLGTYDASGVSQNGHAVVATTTDYQFALVMGGYDINGVPWRSGEVGANYLYGAGYYAQGGVFPTWTLVWRSLDSNTTPLYADFTNRHPAGAIDNFRVPDADLSTVLQPNSLSTFTAANGTSLDAITPEVGGAWTERTGNFDIQTNRANISVASGGRDVATVATSLDDVVSDVVIRKIAAVDSGEIGLCLRYSNDNNFWMVHGDLAANRVEIVERNGGIETLRASDGIALTHSTDYDARAIAYGQTIDAFLDGDNKATYALAALNENATIHGIVGNQVTQTFDNFAIYPRTSAIYDAVLNAV